MNASNSLRSRLRVIGWVRSSAPSKQRLHLYNIHPSLLKMTSFDSIVLGAGFSGLVAARNLASKGHSVLVLEVRFHFLPSCRRTLLILFLPGCFPSLFSLQGRNRTGGRARSYLEGGHAPVDLGCSWVHGWAEGSPVRPLVESLGIVRS
jgi:hypothetical protein